MVMQEELMCESVSWTVGLLDICQINRLHWGGKLCKWDVKMELLALLWVLKSLGQLDKNGDNPISGP